MEIEKRNQAVQQILRELHPGQTLVAKTGNMFLGVWKWDSISKIHTRTTIGELRGNLGPEMLEYFSKLPKVKIEPGVLEKFRQ